MPEIQMIKAAGGTLRPANQSDVEVLEKVRNGNLVHVDFKQPRNARFHRKFFALLNSTFEYWTPEPVLLEDITIKPEKSFERFRKDVLILSGYRHAVVNIKNEVRYEADSISFANMDDTQFHDVYRAVFGVCWRMVLKHVRGMTEILAEQTVNQILSYD
jgi:hypothetical protein